MSSTIKKSQVAGLTTDLNNISNSANQAIQMAKYNGFNTKVITAVRQTETSTTAVVELYNNTIYTIVVPEDSGIETLRLFKNAGPTGFEYDDDVLVSSNSNIIISLFAPNGVKIVTGDADTRVIFKGEVVQGKPVIPASENRFMVQWIGDFLIVEEAFYNKAADSANVWRGTLEEYQALGSYDDSTTYIIDNA